MPSFSSLSSVRVASQDHHLRLKITHNLAHGPPSDVVHSVKGRLPRELDVLWLSDISISISGSLDGHLIPAPDIARSGLVRHLQTQLRANADRLGLNNVSRSFVEDDLSKCLTLTPSRPLPHVSRLHANLMSLHLAYIWRTVGERSDLTDSGLLVEGVHPFSPMLFLPVEALLNRVTEQFLVYHLVSRYPLIFGPWCKRLDLEMQYFPSIGHSIKEIMSRSQDRGFLLKCKRLLKIARRQHKFTMQTCAAALPACTDGAASEAPDGETEDALVLTDEQILCECLEQRFRVGVPQRRFKPAATPQLVSQDDESLVECNSDIGVDETCWAELTELATSPLAGTSPEDMDIFADEEGGMWRLDEADTGLGEREWDAQSDESLISASISLASMNGELDPGGSGLRYKVSALVEEPGAVALNANLTRSSSHARHDSGKYEELVQYTGRCQDDADGLRLDDDSLFVDDMSFHELVV